MQPPEREDRPIRLCVITTVGSSIQVLYRGRLEYLQRNGFVVTCVCAPSQLDDEIRARGVRLFAVPFTRAITPWKDVRALWRLYRFLRREPFDLLEVGTPKAALLGAVAGRLARVPRLVHILHGLSYQGKAGLGGRILRWATAVPCRLAHATFAVSPSVRDQAERDRVCRPGRIQVLGRGSCNGVDLARFNPARRVEGEAIRRQLGIRPEQFVVGFVGRMTRDKGLAELVTAFRTVHAQHPDAVLLLVGGYEDRDLPPPEVVAFVRSGEGVHHAGWQSDPVAWMAAADIIALPSYREGLPGALLEAAALGLPVIATDATGCRDAVVDGETGLRVPVGDADALRDAILRLMSDRARARDMGVRGRAWVARHFDQADVWARTKDAYRQLVAAVPSRDT